MTMLSSMLKKHEGLKLFPYRCTAGKLTIGYGRNLEDTGITEEEADMLLENDIARAASAAMFIFPYFWKYSYKRQSVIISMIFNLGEYKFKTFKKFISAVRAQNWEESVHEMENSLWYAQVGDRGKELAELMRNG